MKKCKIHPKYWAKRPPRANCPDCEAIWAVSPHRKVNVQRCLCLQCGKRINKPEKQLYNYCYITKDMCEYKDCFDCLEGTHQVIECNVSEEEE